MEVEAEQSAQHYDFELLSYPKQEGREEYNHEQLISTLVDAIYLKPQLLLKLPSRYTTP